MMTDSSLEHDIVVGQDRYHWLGSIYGVYLGCQGSPCLQNYGSVATTQGRLLAFPNVMQHRVAPFELVDKEKSGHRQFVALWLVDPYQRIVSTANVPPQQMSWMAEEALKKSASETEDGGKSQVPPEMRPGAMEAVKRRRSLGAYGMGVKAGGPGFRARRAMSGCSSPYSPIVSYIQRSRSTSVPYFGSVYFSSLFAVSGLSKIQLPGFTSLGGFARQ